MRPDQESRSRRSMGLPRPPGSPITCRRRVGPLACPAARCPVRALVGRERKTALLRPLRWRTTCENAGLHSGERVIADKDEVPGSSPGRPTPIVAGQSAAGSEPGALAASLGRAGAARRSPSARPVAPPGPPTRASGAATTTHRGRVPSPRTAATRRCSHRALQPAPVPTAPPPRRALHAGLACLVAQRQARPPRPAPTPAARSASHLPLTNATSTASPASRPPGPSIEPSTARQPQEPPPVPVVTVARPPPEVEGYGRVRTDG